MPKNHKHNTPRTQKKGTRVAALRGPITYSDASIEVDYDAGVIFGASVATIGQCSGHPFSLNKESLDRFLALAAQQPDGVRMRFKHPEINQKIGADGEVRQTVADDTGSFIGRLKNARLDGDRIRGDVHLGTFAAVLPNGGNVREYILRMAQEDPAAIGLSNFFEYEPETVMNEMGDVVGIIAMPISWSACDVVQQPAANPMGLLSANPNSGWSDDNPADPARAPLPVSTPEFPRDVRGDYLKSIVKDGPLLLGGLAARHNGRLEAMRAGADWLVSHGYATKTARGEYAATAKGTTQAAMCWK
jgi:hypothetical protein